MWTHAHLEAHIVWDDVLWEARAVWTPDDGGKPITVEQGGRVPLGADTSPRGALLAAARAFRDTAAPTWPLVLED